MTVNEARQVIYDRFLDNWTGTDVDTEVHLPNNNGFTPPESSPWVRLSVVPTLSQQHTLGAVGARKYQRRGLVALQVFVPVGAGEDEADALVQEFVDLFEGVDDSGINFLDSTPPRGPIEDGRFAQTNVEVAYLYHETR